MGCMYSIPNDRIAVITKCGKFDHLAYPGFLCLPVPCVCSKAGEVSLRIQESSVICETKTKDNVFVSVQLAIQFEVIREKIFEAFYSLQNPMVQINAYVFDVVRSTVPKMLLDDVFESKDEIADQVKQSLAKTMNEFGFFIHQVLVTDINPNPRVRDAMNEINASRRLRMAAAERAEAEKILAVKQAEAEAESKHLQGQGIARQRKAIVDGLRDSVGDFQDSLSGMNAKDILELVLLTQYFDTVKDIGCSGKANAVFVSNSGGTSQELRDAILQSSTVNPRGSNRR
jgi:regulator of protease activity HflC (stomatin/prohibitin superfamily)